jgi:glycerol-3-phosphate acyltransferase PlsY
MAVVCGHNWTVFLQFQGGKGIATSLGVLIGLTISFPSVGPVLLICLLLWLGIFFISGYVSLSSILAGVALPFLMMLTRQAGEMIFLGTIFGIFIVVRHQPNIRRLLRGEESRVKWPFQKR